MELNREISKKKISGIPSKPCRMGRGSQPGNQTHIQEDIFTTVQGTTQTNSYRMVRHARGIHRKYLLNRKLTCAQVPDMWSSGNWRPMGHHQQMYIKMPHTSEQPSLFLTKTASMMLPCRLCFKANFPSSCYQRVSTKSQYQK